MTGEEMETNLEKKKREFSYKVADESNEYNQWIHTQRIDDSTGKRILYTVLGEGIFPEFEKRMLSESGCPFTLPMHFLLDGDRLVAYYDFTGFASIEEHIQNQILNARMDQSGPYLLKECLNLYTNILESIKGMAVYLLSPERMRLTPDNIYVNPLNNKIAFAFIPEPESEASLQERIIRMFEKVQKLCQNPEIDQQLYKFIEIVRRKNLGINGMISLLGSIQRDVEYIYWKGKDFRRLEEDGDHETQEPSEKTQNHEEEKHPSGRLPIKLILFQILLIIGLAGIYFIGRLEMLQFVGLVITVSGIDFLMIRRRANKKPDILSG